MSLRDVGKLLDPPVSGSRVQQEETAIFRKIRDGLLESPEIKEYLQENGLIPWQ
jgi:hypothetical protein